MNSCDECGRSIEGGREGCRAQFGHYTARDFSDALFFRSHRLYVDCYTLQHPEQYCVSAKSLAAHLGGLCAILEYGASAATGSPALHRWLDGNLDALSKPKLPANKGALTLADLPQTDDPEVWAEAMRKWALAVWAAYEPLQPLARQWVEAAKR